MFTPHLSRLNCYITGTPQVTSSRATEYKSMKGCNLIVITVMMMMIIIIIIIMSFREVIRKELEIY